MTAREMHYDFKQKLNAVDSHKDRELYVPEIDWKLNEAQELFIKVIAQPRTKKDIGFEFNQRTINDIRAVVVNQPVGAKNFIALKQYDPTSYIAKLPDDYMYYVSGKVLMNFGKCKDIVATTYEKQHDDEHEVSVFDKSSFLWRTVNIRFNQDGIRLFTDGTFKLTKFYIDYIREPRMIHNAQDFNSGSYNTLEGKTLTGSQDCELSKSVHREIVDLAVYLTAHDLSLNSFQLKERKIALTN